jgi:hypothetical protein
MSDPKVVNAPERIWLVYGDCDSLAGADHSEFDAADVCWSHQSHFSSDVPYVREDLHVAEVERLRTALTRLLDANAIRDHEGMSIDDWNAEILRAEQALEP